MRYRILISCATAGALALAPSAPASALGHHHEAGHGGTTHSQRHGGTHSAGHGSKHVKDRGTRDRLAGPRGAAGHVLRAQAARLTRMLARIGTQSELDAANQAALLAALQSDLDAVSAQLGRVADAAGVHELNAIKHAAVLIATIAGQQVSIVVEADAVEAQAAERAATLTNLAVQVAMAADVGKPVGPAQAALEDAEARLAAVETEAHGAVSTILGVSPTATRSDLHHAFDSASQALLAAQSGLVTVDTDIATVNAVLAD